MFESVLSHDDIKEKIEQDILNNNLSHAYLFFGMSGIGKKYLANEIAKVLLNTQLLMASPDYKLVELLKIKPKNKKDEENEKLKTEISVEQIREIIEDAMISPATGKYKIYVIDCAEKMNSSAQNALLKVLEEPPKGVVFILIACNINNILPTITSRVTKIYFSRISDSKIEKYINKNFNREITRKQLIFANGSLGQAIEIINSETTQKYDDIDDFIESICQKDIVHGINIIKDIDLKDENTVEILENFMIQLKKYHLVNVIEEYKKMLVAMTNEDMVKTNLVIDLCK